MSKGKIIKRIALALLVIVQDIALFIGVIWGIEYIKEQQRINASPYYTEEKFPYSVIYTLDRGYKMQTMPSLLDLTANNKDWPDFSYCTLELLYPESTDRAIKHLNYSLFFARYEGDQDAYDIAIENGLSKDNLMTLEWVLEHPYEAAEIYQAMTNPDWYVYKDIDIDKLLEEAQAKESQQ